MSRRIELAAFVIFGVFAAVILFVLSGSGHPAENPYLPKCPFHLLTGLYCPGCGSTRAVFCLIHGQFSAAFRYNSLFVAMLPVIGLLIVQRLCALILDKTFALPFELPVHWFIAVTVCVYFVLRNIPLECFSALRPH